MCLGIPGKITSITDRERQLGMVDISGVQREINISCITEDGKPLEDHVGDWVLVHVGFAMSRIDEDEASSTLRVLEELGEMREELDAIRRQG